ncbi:MAG: hypothetical protein H8E39_00495 [Alphaproteobacteria bacterium]|nr:hypothetical protein [Alphaproteobacteria bacterium]
MTDTLLETPAYFTGDAAPDGGTPPAAEIPDQDNAMPQPPEGLPEKFWDAERGEIRTDGLLKSYQALEQKLGAVGGLGVPDDAGGYEIQVENELFTSDPEVNARLHAAGFSQEQAQTVYDLAQEYLSPMVSEVAMEFQAQNQIDRLGKKFGGEEKWNETAEQIKTWGRAKFPDEVFQALSGTYDGVLAMHRMMAEDGAEPGLIEMAGSFGESTSETGLQRMMQDPRYWRDHDPAFVSKVHDGFKRLFPD